jgi:hypothetical protein
MVPVEATGCFLLSWFMVGSHHTAAGVFLFTGLAILVAGVTAGL